MNRRSYLIGMGSIGVAGCLGRDTEESPSGADSTAQEPDDTPSRAPRRVSPGTFEDFEDPSAWRVPADTEATVDPERAVVGSQSVRIDVADADRTIRLSREFARPLDLSAVLPGLAVTADRPVNPIVQLRTESGDRVDCRRRIAGGLPFDRYEFGVVEVDGSASLSAVTELHISLWSGEGAEFTVWIDDLHFLARPETGLVQIQFHDTHETTYTDAFPLLDDYGYPAAVFVSPRFVGIEDSSGEDRLTTDQLHELHDAGWTIGNRSYGTTQLTALDPADQEREISDGREWLLDEGFEEGARYFAYPLNDYDATTAELVGEYHELGFAGGVPVHGHISNAALTSHVVAPDGEQATRILEHTAAVGGITTLSYRRLEGDRLSNFESLLAQLHERESDGDLEVVLPAELERHVVE